MKDLKAFQLQKVAVLHNLLLSIGSLVMFLGTSLELLRRWSSSGHFDWFFCEDATTSDGALYFWSYVYYLSKYYETRWCFQVFIYNPIFGASTEFSASCNRYIPGIKAVYTANWMIRCYLKPTARTKNKPMIATSNQEMLDTVLVLLQKSRVPHFKLQVYHHAAVVPMAWLWCETQQSLQWGGLLFNTLVHVIMYLDWVVATQIFIYIFSPLFIIWGRCSSILTSILFPMGWGENHQL